jgi:F-type H+-transporting ATPase subunit delta
MKTSNVIIRLAEIYASTLFDLGRESEMANTVKYNLDALAEVIASENDFWTLLGSPYFSDEYKEQLLRKILSGKIADLTMDFLMVVIRHDRLMLLQHIIEKYNELWDHSNGYCSVKVTVSHAMTDDEVKAMSDDIATSLNSKIRLAIAVEPAIIGGASIRYDDMIIDNTVRNRLQTAVKTIKSQRKGRLKTNEV